MTEPDTLCERNIPVYDIGNIGCSTCEQLKQTGYCEFHKSKRKTRKYESKLEIRLCSECISMTTDIKPNIIKKGYVGRCKIRDIYLTKKSLACYKGVKKGG